MMHHIHADIEQTCDSLEQFLRSCGFAPDNFIECDWPVSYEPYKHWTIKTDSATLLKKTTTAFRQWDAENPGMLVGYMEAEAITTDIQISRMEFNPAVQLPFRLTTKRLPLGVFRQSEIHISFSENETDMRLRQALHDSGFYPARFMETYGPEEIWTIQAARRVDIEAILPATIEYLRTVGGAARCSLQEERVTDYLVSPVDFELPPVINTITWL